MLNETKDMLEQQLETSRKRAEQVLELEGKILQLKQEINQLNVVGSRIMFRNAIISLLWKNNRFWFMILAAGSFDKLMPLVFFFYIFFYVHFKQKINQLNVVGWSSETVRGCMASKIMFSNAIISLLWKNNRFWFMILAAVSFDKLMPLVSSIFTFCVNSKTNSFVFYHIVQWPSYLCILPMFIKYYGFSLIL